MDNPPDLNAMALFARVLQYGSFSEAARRAGTPVSTLSRKIGELEQSLGVRLIERTTRALNPTDAGREFLPHCQQILAALESAQAGLQQRQAEIGGTLRLAAPPNLSKLLLVPLIQTFIERYPKVSVKVLVTDRHLDMVEDEVDISLRVGRQPESSLIFKRLVRYRHILVAAPAYLASAEPLSHPTDLKNHRLLGFSKWFGDVTWKLSKGKETAEFAFPLSLAMNDYAGVIQAAVSGMGIAEVPSILCASELQLGLLQAVIPEWHFDEVDLGAYYLTRRHPSRIVELFLDHCLAGTKEILRPGT
jgi:hypothetical protein